MKHKPIQHTKLRCKCGANLRITGAPTGRTVTCPVCDRTLRAATSEEAQGNMFHSALQELALQENTRPRLEVDGSVASLGANGFGPGTSQRTSTSDRWFEGTCSKCARRTAVREFPRVGLLCSDCSQQRQSSRVDVHRWRPSGVRSEDQANAPVQLPRSVAVIATMAGATCSLLAFTPLKLGPVLMIAAGYALFTCRPRGRRNDK